ncbi:carbohydrate ABC transporter permease [Alloscardovia omnicolens]|uniref:carbohydrate ABC transporter permease n=1 Tax=Alloscardovia omnicolens TaxID=419015 RepID=UPI0006680D9E|nr:carbohydrate ABC transporter permease [Alloscardovia omnicolens]KWZ75580.1 ABC transporter, permease protein [Alloscardovia omnicolens]MDK6249487.1 carbohydrate ABC transporter permease [Alloscardovia omnicolens]MDK6327322.1 carbohydrate ABC transporter permease [Alloscardovia omnicolens]MDK6664141.1 carbohydrate ABC transporter permease [Alloscardovia omnicolens]MDK7748456.1 carbohydrate ABC transporter permease [Alloscardovia omnicolens]
MAQVPVHKIKKQPRAFTVGVLVVACIYFIVPVWWLFVAATKTNSGLFFGAHGSLWFDKKFALWDNIVALTNYQGGIYWRWILNSFFYAFVGGFLATAVAVFAGYGFAKYRFRGKNLFFNIVLGALMIPSTALVIPTFLLMSKFELTDTIWAVLLPSMLNPMGVYLMRIYCHESLPDEMIEAARVDGANEMYTFFKVSLPIMRPAVTTVFLLSVVAAWNNYFLPQVVLTSQKLFPITVGLTNWQVKSQAGAASEQVWNLVTSGAFLSIVPMILAFLFLQRYWVGGLTAGSVKA